MDGVTKACAEREMGLEGAKGVCRDRNDVCVNEKMSK